MDEKQSQTSPSEEREETKMTHIASFQGPRGEEFRLHDAEFRGAHYFDFRRYKKMERGFMPTQKGIRLSSAGVGFLEDAVLKWKSLRSNLDNVKNPDNPGKGVFKDKT